MPSYKVKHQINILTGTRKAGNKAIKSYKPGESVTLTPEQALSHATALDMKPEELEKLQAASEPEPAKEPAKR